MAVSKSAVDWDIEQHYQLRVKPMLPNAPWLLRISEHKDKPPPVLIIKERLSRANGHGAGGNGSPRHNLEERGLLYGQQQRRCLPIVRAIISRVHDQSGIPLELHTFLPQKRISFRGNLPLDDEAGVKLALIFRLQERVQDMDRVELIARRVERFTGEEAAYWFSRITHFGQVANRWAIAGMRIMLAGQPADQGVEKMLEQMR